MNVKVNGTLDNADKVVDSTFWIGVYPGINQEMIEYVKEVFEKFITTYVKWTKLSMRDLIILVLSSNTYPSKRNEKTWI